MVVDSYFRILNKYFWQHLLYQLPLGTDEVRRKIKKAARYVTGRFRVFENFSGFRARMHFSEITRKDINKRRFDFMNNGQKDVDKYIEELKEKDGNNSNDAEVIENIKGLVRLYEKRILDEIDLCKGVREIVNSIVVLENEVLFDSRMFKSMGDID